MSYILDALKRAETERERGHVPGLHTQAHTAGQALPASSGTQPWIWTGLAITMVASVVAWWIGSQPATVQTNTPPSVPPAAHRTAVETPLSPTLTRVPETPYKPAPVNSDAGASALAAPPVPARVRALPASAPSKVAVPPPAARSTAPAQTPTSEVGELNEELRRQLPPLQVTGAVYSSNPAQRLLLVNGLVLPQGSSVAQDLVIDEIGPRSSVLRFRGQRFKVNH